MADLIRKTQFEKIVPFRVLNAIMKIVEAYQNDPDELTAEYIKQNLSRQYEIVMKLQSKSLIHIHCIELAAFVILLANRTDLNQSVKPDS